KGEYDPRFFDYQTSLTYKLSDKVSVNFLGNAAINNYRFIPATRTTNFGTSTAAKQFKVYFDGSEKDRFETFFGAATLNFTPDKKNTVDLLLSGFLSNELVAYDISGEYWLDQAGTSGEGSIGGELGVGKYREHARNRLKASVLSAQLRGASQLGRHNLAYGIGLNLEKIHDRTREWELRDSAGFSLPVNPDALQVIYNLDSRHDINSTRFSGYIQDTYRLSTSAGYLNISGGVRFGYWSFNKEMLVSPRLSLGFVPDAAPRWAFRFATGMYYQSPFYKEFRMPVADADGNNIIVLNNEIKSPRSIQVIGGADFTFRAFSRPFKFSAEAYYKNLNNLIPYELDNLKLVYAGQNLCNGMAAGVDFKLFGQFVPGSDSWISLSLMKTQENLNGVKVPLPSDRRYSMALFFTDYFPKFPKLKFSLRGILNDGLPMTPPRSSRDKGYFRAPAYKRVDIGLSYALLSPHTEGSQSRTGIARHLKSVWLGVDVFN
ncbi:MAG: TonB-dependent receptor, partial [Muribaculaceae bacterium]|nr:TonB-dependent receptor [Muribaculaceae bacterium]